MKRPGDRGEFRTESQFSDRPPLRLVLVLGGGFVVLVLAGWLVAGLVVDWVADQVPAALERRIGELLPVSSLQSDAPELIRARDHLQALVDRMAASLEPTPLSLSVHVVDDATVNAAALPGGHIVVYRGLLETVASENELSMILGHEIGHHLHRDHLRAIGRRLVAAWILYSILGSDGGLTDVGLEGLQREHSRDAESKADTFGLNLLVEVYGHAGGATDFFARIAGQEPSRTWRWLSTHPLSAARIEAIERQIAQAGFRMDEPQALPSFAQQ